VSILGFSYGTKLAMHYARRYPDHLDRIVLQGPTDGDMIYRPERAHDALLARFARMAESDSASATFSRNLVPRIGALLERAERTPFVVRIRTIAGDTQPIPVGKRGLQALISGRVTDGRIPALVATLEAGDMMILTRWVESMYNDLATGSGSLMARALTCSTPPSAQRRAQVDKEGASSLLGPAPDNFVLVDPFCGALGGATPSQAPRTTASIARPALFITGELDDRTPPSNADVLAAEFSQPITTIVANGGHELLPSPAVRDAVIRFFLGNDVRDVVLTEPTPRFLSIESAKQPPRRPGQ
jgi:pimeloyl-ACP methyl ester carboxylesterase